MLIVPLQRSAVGDDPMLIAIIGNTRTVHYNAVVMVANAQQLDAAIARSGGYLGQAKALLEEGITEDPQTEGFIQSFAKRDPIALLQVLVPMERWKRDQFIPVIEQWVQVLHGALMCRSGISAISPAARQLSASRSSNELMSAIVCLQKAITYAQGNVSVAAICSYLEWALR